MTKFEVGKPFPIETGHKRMTDSTLVSFNDKFFDIIFYSTMADDDAATWRKGKLRYGVLHSDNDEVDFFLLDFGDFSLDVSLNFMKTDQSKAEEWLNSEANMITLYLVDANTHILKGMRLIGIKHDIAEEIRDNMENQALTYTADQIDRNIKDFMVHHTTSMMIDATEMQKL